MKKALRIATAGIMALAFLFSCTAFSNLTQAAPKKTTVTITSPVKVKNGKTGKYTLYQIKNQKASVKIKAKASSGKLKYSSSDKSILTVTSKGEIKSTGKTTGMAYITVSSASYKKAKAKILVTVANFAPKMSKTALTIKENATDKLSVTGKGIKSVAFKSSNSKIATVDNNGKVKGIAAGNAVITATVTSVSGVATALSAKVTVAKAVYKFYLTRHGETMFNTLDISQGQSDSPLTESGIAMAKQLGKSMAKIPFDKAYTSDLGRTRATTKYILEGRDVPVILDENLRETSCGSLEGKKDKKNYMERIGWEVGYKAEGGETMHQTADRVAAAMQRIIAENKSGGTFLVTSHGGAILTYLDSLIGPNAEGNNGDFLKADPLFQQFLAKWGGAMPNCAVSEVTYADGKFTVDTISDVSWLGSLAPRPPAEEEKPEYTFYLTRHGQTVFNVRGVAQGWTDSPLTDEGVAMAKKLNKTLAKVDFDKAYSSDLARAYNTAQYILEDRDVSIITDKNLRETNLGDREGLPNSTDPVDAMTRFTTSLGYTDVGGENMEQTGNRVQKAIQRIISENKKGGTFLVTSHGGSLAAYLDQLIGYQSGKPTADWFEFLSTWGGSMPNCAVSIVTYKEGVGFTVKSVSDVSYLEELAPKPDSDTSDEVEYTFYLTRHGQTVFNTMDIGQGWTDSPLTKDSKDPETGETIYGGVSMAKQLGKSMAKIPFDKAYTSDLTRAYETAEYIIEGRNIPLIINKDLRETNLGDLEGQPKADNNTERIMTDLGWTDVHGENMKQTGDRVAKAIDQIIAENKKGGTFLVTSHGGAITAYLDKLVGPRAHNGVNNDADQIWKDFMAKWYGSMPNCAVSVVTYNTKTKAFTVKSISDTSYLGKMDPDKTEYEFYITRHGETIANTLDIGQGWSDSPLTQDTKNKDGKITAYGGVSMAKHLNKTMKDIDFDKAYSSDLTRAYETAGYILEGRNVPIITDKNLRETNLGSLENKGPEADEKGLSVRVADKIGWTDVGGESIPQTGDRMLAALNRIISENKKGGTFLVTSHGGAITALLDILIGFRAAQSGAGMDDRWMPFIQSGAPMPNCCVTHVTYKNGVFTVDYFGSTEFLEGLVPEAEPDEPEFTFYLTRHGQTVFNTMDIGQGWTDSPLTGGETGGVAMAQKLGETMAEIPFDKAYTSDLTRAKETAEYIIGERKIQLVQDKNLRETNLGSLEGKPRSEDTVDNNTRLMTDLGWTDVGGENMKQTAARVDKALQRIREENKKGGTFLVTSHGGAIIAFIDSLIGPMAHNGDFSQIDPLFRDFVTGPWKGNIPNCGVSVVKYKEGKFTVESIGDTSYLGELAPNPNEEDEAVFTFYLTRHGETMFNVLGLAQGWCDSPLTGDTEDPETHEITKYGGISMAKELGKNMKDIPFDKCYTSISERAYDTAKYIIGDRKIPLIIDENLKETNCGSVEGTKDTVNFMDRIGWDAGYVNEGGESMHMTADRVAKAINQIIKDNKKGGMFLVTSHGGAILSYLDSLFGPNAEGNEGVLANADPKFQEFMATWHGSMPNCAVSIVQYSKANGFTLTSISDTQYLGDLAPQPKS